MELEKKLRNLRIENDINELSKEELIEKYGDTKEDAEYFMHTFSEMFIFHDYYPSMIFEDYDKVSEVLEDFNERYTKGTQFEHVYHEILGYMIHMETRIPSYDSKSKISSDLFSMHENEIGTDDIKHVHTFSQLNKMLEDGVEKIDKNYKKNSHFPNKYEYEAILKKAEVVGLKEDPMREIAIIEGYKDYYPMLNLCHDINVLVAINDLLTDAYFEDKEELGGIARNVIDFSLSFKPIGESFDAKEYKKVAKATKSLLKRQEKGYKGFSYKKHH